MLSESLVTVFQDGDQQKMRCSEGIYTLHSSFQPKDYDDLIKLVVSLNEQSLITISRDICRLWMVLK